MSETRRYADLAQCFARLAARATAETEQSDYHVAAAAYLQLAKGAAAIEVAGAALAALELDWPEPDVPEAASRAR
jgi:hypothetical protein